MEDKKYKYKVTLIADDLVSGYIELTKQEAELVARVTNPKNWEITEEGVYAPDFEIDLDNPVEI